MSNKDLFLSELFHYDCSSKKHAALKKGLEEYQFLLLVSISAAQSLQNGDLEKFDALVGENACQIRAVKIAIIASSDLTYLEDLLQRLRTALKITEQLLTEKSINSLMRSGISLKEILALHNLDIQLCEDEMFFIQAHVLSEMKECLSDKGLMISLCREERSVPNKLRFIAPKISSSFLGSLSSKFKKMLSESSVHFVTKTAQNLQNPFLLQVLSENIQYCNTRPCTPMFWTYKTLLFLAQKEKIPILLHTKVLNKFNNYFHITEEKFLYFKTCPNSREYIQTIPTEEDLTLPACVVEGVVYSQDRSPLFKQHWIDSLNNYSVLDVILAGAADHRQYPNQEPVSHIQDEEFERYKKMAKQKGFSFDNPRTFFIHHVYPSLVGKAHPLLKHVRFA